MIALAFALFLAPAVATPSPAAVPVPVAAAKVIVLVRHAEKASATEKDPLLSEAGTARAEKLAEHLTSANVTAILTTELQRTRLTAAPLAKRLGLTPVVVPSKSEAKVVAARALEGTGTTLVVGHSNTVPEILAALGVGPVTIGDDEYANLFVVVAQPGAPPTLVTLRY